MRASDLPRLSRQKSGYTQTALVLQGGGPLGAYQAGVYQALPEGGCEPDWVCSVSTGAINAAIIVYFDTTERAVTADHVMAGGALQPGFPAICIDGEFYWDGGLNSNTPLVHLLDEGPKQDTLVFQVDLFEACGKLPGDAIELEERRKQIPSQAERDSTPTISKSCMCCGAG